MPKNPFFLLEKLPNGSWNLYNRCVLVDNYKRADMAWTEAVCLYFEFVKEWRDAQK